MPPRDSASHVGLVTSAVNRLSSEAGLLGAEELEHVLDALIFSEHAARAVLIQTGRLVTVPETDTAADVEARVAETGFCRFPVGRSDGRLIGYVQPVDVIHPGLRRNRPCRRR